MKKIRIFVTVLFFSIAVWSTASVDNVALVQAKVTEKEHIQSFDSNIRINKDGTIDVKESIIYDFGNLDRHGIYRTIPYTKKNLEGKTVKLDFNIVSVLDEKGNSYRYSLIWSGDQLQIKIGDPTRTITGVHTYIISYKVAGALTYFSDHDELYWNVTGNDWAVPMQQAKAEITLPSSVSVPLIKITCYTGSYGSTESLCHSSINGSIISVETQNILYANQGLTAVVGFPKGTVAVLEPKVIVPFFQTIPGKLVAILLFLLATIWYVVYPIRIIYEWFKHGRDPKGTIQEVAAWYDPPKSSKSNRFLTPGEVGTLGDETADLKDISATIIDLARRGFLRIEERGKGDFYFISTKPAFAKASAGEGGLLAFEKRLLNGLFESGKEIRLKDEELYESVQDVKKNLYEDVVTEGLFPKNPDTIRTFYSVIAVLALVTGNLFLAAVAFIFGRNMPVKTVEGVNAFHESKSLKNFLTSQERQLAFQADKQMMFERLLPYAIAFGVEAIWAKRFANISLKPPEWYQGYSTGTFNSIIFTQSLNSSMSSFSSAAHPPSSSSSGFSGGFSGGGGGGGGGGSW